MKAVFGTGKVLGKVLSGICRLPDTFVSQGRFILDPPGPVVPGQRFKSYVCGCVCVLLPVSGLTTRVYVGVQHRFAFVLSPGQKKAVWPEAGGLSENAGNLARLILL